MNFRGVTPFTTVDYPGKLACVFYVGGCDFRCPYCHNGTLARSPSDYPEIPEAEVFAFLRKRVGRLDAVVVSGGEPTLRPELSRFAAAVKAMGFLVKIDTNGARPAAVLALADAGTLDALGVDYKAPAAKYPAVARCSGEAAKGVAETLRAAAARGIPLDCRTTVHKSLLSPEDIRLMRQELDALGVSAWTLQQFHKGDILDPSLAAVESYSDAELAAIAASLPRTAVRGVRRLATAV